MIKKVLLGLMGLFLVGMASLTYMFSAYVTAPTFSVDNSSTVPVHVTAFWRQTSRDLGDIVPGQKVEFEINDEAAIYFKARYPNGKELTSSEIYFTSNIAIQAKITESGIEVNYESDT